MKNSRQLTIDFRAVSHATLHYTNQLGETRRTLPTVPTVNGEAVPACNNPAGEPMINVARRLKLLDIWTPVCVLQLRNNHSLTFKGQQARKKWKAYNAHIFS